VDAARTQSETYGPETLRANLAYEPRELKFGTSGRRGDVVDLTQLEITINALAELEYLKSLPKDQGGIVAGDEFYYACDLRPSSVAYVPEERGRGEIAQAIEEAIRDAGMQPVNLGKIPTPALTFHAISLGRGSIMVTGSHIPFDRNGYKTNSAIGELLKKDEDPITAHVAEVRERIYNQPFADTPFDSQGLFKAAPSADGAGAVSQVLSPASMGGAGGGPGHRALLPESSAGRDGYLKRYRDFFAGATLAGRRIVVYQHSAVGRDLLVEILRAFSATVIPAGRSDTFVPIDTENIDDAQLATIQTLADESAAAFGPIDAVVSTDGDSDRPLVLGVQDGKVRFFGGDLVGMIVAEYLGADAVVVPISCNDAIDRGSLKDAVEPKTKIGSPHVIVGMQKARANGKRVVCGWEANGGFLTGSDITRAGHTLTALPTRDAFLPILSVLFASAERQCTVSELFETLPRRFSKAALLKKFPRPTSLKIVAGLSPGDPRLTDVVFNTDTILTSGADGAPIDAAAGEVGRLSEIRQTLSEYFTSELGFGGVVRINYIDGVRVYFANGDVAHVRPSGNADELRIYAVADTQDRADAIARDGVAEPDGILRRLEKAFL